MASTVQDIVHAAYRKINVTAEDETLSDAGLAEGVAALNRMLNAWKLQGVNVGPQQLIAADDFPLNDEYEEGTIYLLAERLGHTYNAPPNFDADAWFRQMQAAYAVVEESEMPLTFRLMRSQSQSYRG
jgi:hypothetical protein